MIKYQMRCVDGHLSEIWFRDSASCDEQLAAGQVYCPSCGGGGMAKALMAPGVVKAGAKGGDAEPNAETSDVSAPASAPEPAAASAGKPARPMAMTAEAMRREIEGRLRALRSQIESSSEDVGEKFATEARAIHSGEAEERAIRGQCSPDEARDLIDEGVPVTPLPWIDHTDD